MGEDKASQIAGIAALDEPARRALYGYVAAQAEPVGREQAAAGCDLPLHTARFHLDRLVDEGLLDVEFRRLSDRSGPGAGRPSKLYRRSGRELSVSFPERRYDLAGDIFAEAIDRSMQDGISVAAGVAEVAQRRGREAAAAAGARRRSSERTRATKVLAQTGYEPRSTTNGEICLVNCPFDQLARRHTEVVCSMNLAFVDGVLAELGCESLAPVLDPDPDSCCVKVRAR